LLSDLKTFFSVSTQQGRYWHIQKQQKRIHLALINEDGKLFGKPIYRIKVIALPPEATENFPG
jgi:hypothetical protein